MNKLMKVFFLNYLDQKWITFFISCNQKNVFCKDESGNFKIDKNILKNDSTILRHPNSPDMDGKYNNTTTHLS